MDDEHVAVELHAAVWYKMREDRRELGLRQLDLEQPPQHLAQLRRCQPLPRKSLLQHAVFVRMVPWIAANRASTKGRSGLLFCWVDFGVTGDNSIVYVLGTVS